MERVPEAIVMVDWQFLCRSRGLPAKEGQYPINDVSLLLKKDKVISIFFFKKQHNGDIVNMSRVLQI